MRPLRQQPVVRDKKLWILIKSHWSSQQKGLGLLLGLLLLPLWNSREKKDTKPALHAHSPARMALVEELWEVVAPWAVMTKRIRAKREGRGLQLILSRMRELKQMPRQQPQWLQLRQQKACT